MADQQPPNELTWSEECSEVFAAAGKAQAAMGPLTASKTAEIKSQKGNFEYSYAGLPDTLAACLHAYNAQGIYVAQPVATFDNGVEVRTTLLHSSGQWIKSPRLFIGLRSAGAQDIGSAITYARRYSLQGMVGLSPADDDGGQAQGKAPDKWEPPQRSERRTVSRPAGPNDLGPRCSGPKGGHIGEANDRHVHAISKGDDRPLGEVWTWGIKSAAIDVTKYQGGWPQTAQQLTIGDGMKLRDFLKSQLPREPGDDGDEQPPADPQGAP